MGREVERTMGVRPMVKRFLVLLRFTMLKMILWSGATFSTEKLNQNLTTATLCHAIMSWEPDQEIPVARIASVRPHEQIILVIIDEVHTTEVACKKIKHLNCGTYTCYMTAGLSIPVS